MTNFNNFNNQAYNNQQHFNQMQFQMQFARDYEKNMHKEQLRKKSSGLGFYLFAYLIAMNAVAIFLMFFSSFIFVFQDKDLNYALEVLSDPSSPLMHFMSITSAVFSAFVPGLFYLSFSKTHISDCIKTRYVKPSLFFPLIFIGMAVSMIANISSELLAQNFSLFGLENSYELDSSSGSLFCNILYVISTAVTPAFAEEFAFRGVMLGVLRKYGDSFAIIVSSVMFGLMHGNISQIPFAFMLGLIFGYITCKTNSIFPAIAIHFVNNCYAVILDVLQSEEVFTERMFNIVGFSLILLFCVLGAVSFMIIMKKDKDFLKISDDSKVVNLTLKEKVKAFIFSPGVLFCLPLYLMTTVKYLLPTVE